jgi:hypothetical protein
MESSNAYQMCAINSTIKAISSEFSKQQRAGVEPVVAGYRRQIPRIMHAAAAIPKQLDVIFREYCVSYVPELNPPSCCGPLLGCCFCPTLAAPYRLYIISFINPSYMIPGSKWVCLLCAIWGRVPQMEEEAEDAPSHLQRHIGAGGGTLVWDHPKFVSALASLDAWNDSLPPSLPPLEGGNEVAICGYWTRRVWPLESRLITFITSDWVPTDVEMITFISYDRLPTQLQWNIMYMSCTLESSGDLTAESCIKLTKDEITCQRLWPKTLLPGSKCRLCSWPENGNLTGLWKSMCIIVSSCGHIVDVCAECMFRPPSNTSLPTIQAAPLGLCWECVPRAHRQLESYIIPIWDALRCAVCSEYNIHDLFIDRKSPRIVCSSCIIPSYDNYVKLHLGSSKFPDCIQISTLINKILQ